jgi:hypothetical protein
LLLFASSGPGGLLGITGFAALDRYQPIPEDFAVSVATEKLDVKVIAAWLKEHCVRLAG